MNLLRHSIRVLVAGAIFLPSLASAQPEPPTGVWTLGAPDNATTLYRNDTSAMMRISVMVCYEHYSRSADKRPAPSVMIGVVPPVEARLQVDLGNCNTVSFPVNSDSKVNLIFSSPEGGIATGSYRIVLP